MWLWWLPKMEQFVTKNLIDSERQQLVTVSELLMTSLLNNDFSVLHESLDALRDSHKDWRYIKLADGDGQEIYPLGTEFVSSDPQLITIGHTITLRNLVMGRITLVVDPRARLARLRGELLQLIWVFGLMVASSLLAILFFVEYFVSGPARKLSSATMQLATGNYDVRVVPDSKDEIGLLGLSFNIMRRNLIETNKAKDRAQKELEASLKIAKNANQAKSNFLSTMSHEIRTPLNGVLGLAQLLSDTDLSQDQHKKIQSIMGSGETLLAILNDVLDISKIEAGGIELENSPFNLKHLISLVTPPFERLADDKGLVLEINDKIDDRIVLKGDPTRLRQVLWNLLSNAIKFTDKGGVILTIEEYQTIDDNQVLAHFSELKKYHLIRFTFQDDGPGIATDRLDAIFELFSQEDNTITRKYGGTGLGLAIVKQLTELMGGTIRVESQLGKGSRFIVDLPFEMASKEEADLIGMRKADDELRQSEPMNILVAEDNDLNALIVRAFLEKFGHAVRHVENGKLAVEAAKEDWADFIFMDIHMPEMDGIDATRIIRSTPSGENLPIVGLTAEAFTDRHALFVEVGMNGVLTKPFTEHQLADTIALYSGKDRRNKARDITSGLTRSKS